jgi:small subunit ribosomal protein S5
MCGASALVLIIDNRVELKARIIFVRRSSRMTKGGARYTFSALAVVGTCGSIGLGLGKSGEVADAILKAETSAARGMQQVKLHAGTIPHEVRGQYCGAQVLLRPAPPGTGIIASRAVRAVLECAGVKDAVSKSLGSRNPTNVAYATLQALTNLQPHGPKVPILLDFGTQGHDPLRLN